MKHLDSVKAFICTLLTLPSIPLHAGEFVVGMGLWQPIVFKGLNFEIDYITKNWVFEYSHGMNLHISSFEPALTTDEKEQRLDLKAPYSTGFGIGYQFTEAINFRLEFKEHKFEVRHLNGESLSYINRDIGVGAYYFWQPFQESGFIVIPSLRYWPNVTSTLPQGGHTFSNGDVHMPHEFNFFGNATVGWKF